MGVSVIDSNAPTMSDQSGATSSPIKREPLLHWFARPVEPRDQYIAERFADLAVEIEFHVPRSAERTVALRKLIEALDATKRALDT